MDKNKVKFLVDFSMFFVFLIIMISGFILWFVLPGGSKEGVLLKRNSWIMIHNWLSVLLIVLLLIHLILNWAWIKAMFRNIFKTKTIEVENEHS